METFAYKTVTVDSYFEAAEPTGGGDAGMTYAVETCHLSKSIDGNTGDAGPVPTVRKMILSDLSNE